MTYEKALERINGLLKYAASLDVDDLDPDFNDTVALHMACKEALEKQIPKKVVSYGDDESDHVYCPCCHECIGSNEIVYDDFYYRGWATMHCQECGQAMVWR